MLCRFSRLWNLIAYVWLLRWKYSVTYLSEAVEKKYVLNICNYDTNKPKVRKEMNSCQEYCCHCCVLLMCCEIVIHCNQWILIAWINELNLITEPNVCSEKPTSKFWKWSSKLWLNMCVYLFGVVIISWFVHLFPVFMWPRCLHKAN